MKLWLLRPRAREDLPKANNPWHPWYDKCFGFVIRAQTELAARVLANKSAGDENCVDYDVNGNVWLDSHWTTCVELKADTEVEESIIMADFHSA